MLTEAKYVEQQRSLGCRIHEHDGVFWEEVYPFYCKPAFIYKPFDPGEARPLRLRSLLGYSHQVLNPEYGNRSLTLMVLEGADLKGFCIEHLSANKRSVVRRGLKRCEIRLLDKPECHLERIREINASQAIRHEQGVGSIIPARRYTEEADDWRAQMRREFVLEGREWWGAFVEGVLAAYLLTYQVDGVMNIQQAKADTACLKSYPMDALYFNVLSRSAADANCQRIINGGSFHQSLDHFKEQFLFKAVEVSYYSSNAWLVEMAKKLVSAWRILIITIFFLT